MKSGGKINNTKTLIFIFVLYFVIINCWLHNIHNFNIDKSHDASSWTRMKLRRAKHNTKAYFCDIYKIVIFLFNPANAVHYAIHRVSHAQMFAFYSKRSLVEFKI